MKTRPPGVGLKLLEQKSAVEASLWRRLRHGAEQACRIALFERYIGLARAVARGERRRRPAYGLDKPDFEQLAFSGLLEAIDRFDPLLGPPFAAYARPRIRGAISDGIAHSSEASAAYSARQRIEVDRLRSLASGKNDTEQNYLQQLAELAYGLAIGLIAERSGRLDDAGARLDPYEGLAWRELTLNLSHEIARLAPAERSVIEQHYFNGVAFSEIARMMGLSKGRVSQLHRSALLRVREGLKRLDRD